MIEEQKQGSQWRFGKKTTLALVISAIAIDVIILIIFGEAIFQLIDWSGSTIIYALSESFAISFRIIDAFYKWLFGVV